MNKKQYYIRTATGTDPEVVTIPYAGSVTTNLEYQANAIVLFEFLQECINAGTFNILSYFLSQNVSDVENLKLPYSKDGTIQQKDFGSVNYYNL